MKLPDDEKELELFTVPDNLSSRFNWDDCENISDFVSKLLNASPAPDRAEMNLSPTC